MEVADVRLTSLESTDEREETTVAADVKERKWARTTESEEAMLDVEVR
jgi:hypothetical protein